MSLANEISSALATIAQQPAQAKVSFPVNPFHIHAAAMFLNLTSERSYCRGVMVEVGLTEQFTVGTDGKRLFLARHEVRSRPEVLGSYLLNGEDLKRVKKARHIYLCRESETEMLATFHEGEKKTDKGSRAFLGLVEGPYPRFRHFAATAIKAVQAPAAQFSAENISDCERAARMLGSDQFFLKNIYVNKTGMGLITFSVPDAFALLQETPRDPANYELPLWAERLTSVVES